MASLIGEQAQEYASRMGKWARQVLAALETREWWMQMTISHVCREPLDRLMLWLQGVSTEEAAFQDAGDLAGGVTPARAGSPVVALVTGRCRTLMEGMAWLLDTAAWESDAAWERVARESGERRCWRQLALSTVLGISADIYRRIILPAEEWPMRLCWLVAAPPDEEHAMRQQVCRDLLAEHMENSQGLAESLCGLLRRSWAAELASAAASRGRISPALHSFMDAVRSP